MSLLLPERAAVLASSVYGVQNQLLLKGFLNNKEFSANSKQKKTLAAQSGTRLINRREQFGICVRGAGDYSNDLFVIFRGTDTAADFFTNGRLGLTASA